MHPFVACLIVSRGFVPLPYAFPQLQSLVCVVNFASMRPSPLCTVPIQAPHASPRTCATPPLLTAVVTEGRTLALQTATEIPRYPPEALPLHPFEAQAMAAGEAESGRGVSVGVASNSAVVAAATSVCSKFCIGSCHFVCHHGVSAPSRLAIAWRVFGTGIQRRGRSRWPKKQFRSRGRHVG